MENNKAGLIFNSFHVVKTVFERNTLNLDYSVSVNIQHNINTETNNEKVFIVSFLVTLKTEESELPFILEVEAAGVFSIVGEPNETEYNNFLRISAPSILYPYIRAYISNFTLSVGINPIVLPTVNFATQVDNTIAKGEDKEE